MEELPGKVHYCFKIFTLHYITYPLLQATPYMDYLPTFLQESLGHPFYDISEMSNPLKQGGRGVHTMYVYDSLYIASTWYKLMCPPFLKTAVVSEIFYFKIYMQMDKKNKPSMWTKRAIMENFCTCGENRV